MANYTIEENVYLGNYSFSATCENLRVVQNNITQKLDPKSKYPIGLQGYHNSLYMYGDKLVLL